MNARRLGYVTILIALGLMAMRITAEEESPVQWSGKDLAGKEISVPSAQKPTVMLFVMADQVQSQEAIKQVGSSLAAAGDVQALVIVSGDQAAEHASKIHDSKQCPWPIVADPDYSASGKASVKVWPTTVLLSQNGQVVAHLAGVPKNYAKDLDSYLAFATGKIDKAELDKRLTTDRVIVDSPEQIASRHLMIAQRLLDKGLTQQARTELAAGLKLHPQSPALQLAMTRVLIALGESDEASKVLDNLETAPVSPSQVALLRGKLMVQLSKWDLAAELLQRAVKLNPEPAEAWYELGLVYQHTNQWDKAADAFRRAFEATDSGRKIIPATQPVPVK